MNRTAPIFIAGGGTIVGAALHALLPDRGFTKVLAAEPDLTDASEVRAYFASERPEYVFLVGGMSGGIGLNRERPAELMLDNLRIATNVIDAAHRHHVTKLLYLASSCAYPKQAPQPLRVESLGTGPMEPTSEAYSTAMYAGLKLCEAYRRQYGCSFITGIPANAFGPHDDFSRNGGHVIPSLIRRTHEARANGDDVLSIWGTGTPRREFIFSRDLAEACLFAMQNYEGTAPLNLGGSTDVSIAEVARTIAEVVGYRGHLAFDPTKPDGAPRKALDSAALQAMGWRPRTRFRDAVAETYEWFLKHRTDRPHDQHRGAARSKPSRPHEKQPIEAT